MQRRFIFNNNSVIKDLTVGLNKYDDTSTAFAYQSGDYLYINSSLPFNNIFIKVGSPNAVATTMSVGYWTTDGWISAIEVIDETNGLFQSGRVTFTPNRDKGWEKEDTNYSGNTIDGLESLNIYTSYWIRISFNQTLTSTTRLDWIGQIFSDDDDLNAEFPNLNRNNVRQAFQAGKTSWEEQHVRAAELIIKDLEDNQILNSGNQILIASEFKNASVQKVAEIIYTAMGDDYADQKTEARREYQSRLSRRIARVDRTAQAIVTNSEKGNETGFLRR